MKALLTLKSAVNQSSYVGIMALVMLIPVILPEAALAAELQTLGQPAQIFKIKVSDPNLVNQTLKTNTIDNSLNIETVANNDPLVVRLRAYLEKNNSPMAPEAAELVQHDQWERGLAISFVESNFCRKAMNKNCSSIGVAPGHKLWRKYQTYGDWMADMSALMNKPLYKERLTTFAKMKGVYVQPGSMAWVNGAQKVYNELAALKQAAESERQAQAQQQVAMATSLTTFPEQTN